MRQIAQSRITRILSRDSVESTGTEELASQPADRLPEPPFEEEVEAEQAPVPPSVDLSRQFPEAAADEESLADGDQKAQIDHRDEVDSVPEPLPPQTLDEAVQLLTKLGVGIERDYDGYVRGIDAAYLKITDDHAKILPLLGDITELDLTGTDISDAALSQIAEMTSLQSLKLKGTPVSDQGIEHIVKLTHLRILDLGRTQVTDSALSHLQGLNELHYLLLDHTAVSDAGMAHLKSLPALRGINLIGSKVTADGLSRLEKELPRCLIVTQSGDDVSFLHLPPEFSLAANGSHARTSDDQNADVQLRRLLQLAYQDPELAEHVASVYSEKGQWSKSAAILEVAAKFRPDDERLQFRLAESLAYAGRTDEAYELFRRFVGEAAANYAVGVIIYEKALKTSESFLERCVAIDPANLKARGRLDEIRGRQKSVPRNPARSAAASTVSLPRIVPRAHLNPPVLNVQPLRRSPYQASPASWTQR